MAREREVKLAAYAGFELPALDGLLDGVTSGELPVRTLVAVYHDTDDLRLARWGVSVRYRTGDGTGWTVKLPDGDDGPALVRRELHVAGPRSSVPAGVSDLVRAYLRTAALVPVTCLRTRRRGMELLDGEGQRVAEVVDDEVSVYEGRRLAARFREVEVEEVEGAPAGLLDVVVTRLREAGAGKPDPTPKVVRALGARALAPPELPEVALGKAATAADVVRAAMTGAVIRILRHDAGVRIGDDPEDVHQARVGTRRLRSDLRTFRPLVDPDWVGELRDELKWLADLLGAARDCDVLIERFRRQAAHLEERDAEGLAALLRRLARQQDDARSALLQGIGSPRYAELLDRLVDAAARPVTTEDAQRPASDVLPDLVRVPWRHLNKAVDQLGKNPPDEALHEARIRAKRVRYAAEAAAPVLGRRARDFAKAVAGLQTVLGDHQDAVVAEAWLRDNALEDSSPAEAMVAGQLIASQRAEAEAQRAAWRKAWKAASAKKLRTWLD